MKKIVRYIDQLTNRTIPNRTAPTRPPFPPKSDIVVRSPPFSTQASPIRIHSRSKGSLINHARRWISKKITNRRRCTSFVQLPVATPGLTRCDAGLIDVLPDDVLLVILDFYANVDGYEVRKEATEAWQTVAHVCRRWRIVVFASPRRLNLRLVCTPRTPARDLLDIWPALPLVVQWYGDCPIEGVDNIVAALERSNRVCQIVLYNVPTFLLEKASATMQEPFPELTYLRLMSDATAIPDSFLGGSAPLLRFLEFRGVPFPGLPKLLLSATRLVSLTLSEIPHSGYISPEAMVTALSTLTSLESFHLNFQSPLSFPNRTSRRPAPPIRFALPVLAYFLFEGVTEYLEDLVARIDAPQLSYLDITFFNQIVFDTPQLIQLISRTPVLKALEKVRVIFDEGVARAKFSSLTSHPQWLEVKVLCRELDWQVSSLEQVCTSCLPPLSALEDIVIYGDPLWKLHRQNKIENTLWLELFQPFIAVKNLYLSTEFVPLVVPALQELVGSRTTEVLITLQNMFLGEIQTSGPAHEAVQQFVAMRQATNHPVAVSRWYLWKRQPRPDN